MQFSWIASPNVNIYAFTKGNSKIIQITCKEEEFGFKKCEALFTFNNVSRGFVCKHNEKSQVIKYLASLLIFTFPRF